MPPGWRRVRKLLEASGDQLVGVGLVARVPQDDVAGRVEHAVQGQGQLDGAEIGAQVATVDGDAVDDAGPDLLGQLCQLRLRQRAQVGWLVDVVEEHGHLAGPPERRSFRHANALDLRRGERPGGCGPGHQGCPGRAHRSTRHGAWRRAEARDGRLRDSPEATSGARAGRSRAMRADVKGTTMPVLEMVLEPGEAIDLHPRGPVVDDAPTCSCRRRPRPDRAAGFMAGLKRMAGGGGLLLTRYEATGRPGHGDLRQQAARAHLPHRGRTRARLRRAPPRLGVRDAGHHAVGGAPADVPGRDLGRRGLRAAEARRRGPGVDRAVGRDRHLRARAGQSLLVHPGHVGLFTRHRHLLGDPPAGHRQPVLRRRRPPPGVAHRAGQHLAAVHAAARAGPGAVGIHRTDTTAAATPSAGGVVGGVLGNVLGRQV